MRQSRSRNHQAICRTFVLTFSAFNLASPPVVVDAFALLAPKGQKAVLEYKIEIEGTASGTNNNYQSDKWSTRRTLVVRTTLVASQPMAVDPGVPRTSVGSPKSKVFVGSPQSEVSGKGLPRYQLWLAGSKPPATGTIKIEVQKEQLFKTAVDERETCRETAELKFEDLMHVSTWSAMIKIDAQAGTYVAKFPRPDRTIKATIECVKLIGRQRSEQHSTSGMKFLPEEYREATPDEMEVFSGDADAATDAASGGRLLAHGKKVLTGIYGTLVGDVPMTATVTVRWALTLLKD